MNQLHQMLTTARAQAVCTAAEPVSFGGNEYPMFVGAASVTDQIKVEGYWVQADLIAVVDKVVFPSKPDRTRSQFKIRGVNYRLWATEEDASSWTLKLKENP